MKKAKINFELDYIPHGVVKKTGDLPIPSIQSTYISSDFTSKKNKYEESDSPFLVQFSKKRK